MKKVMLIGVDDNLIGGVASVIRTFKLNLSELNIIHIKTSSDGSLPKILIALKSYISFLYKMIFYNFDIFHVHCSAYGSFYRKIPFFLVFHLLKREYIFHCHSGGFPEFYEKDSFAKFIFDSYVIPRSILVFVSYNSQQSLLDKIDSKYYRQIKTTVMPNYSLPVCKEYNKKNVTGSSRMYFGFFGDVTDLKGFEDAVNFTKSLREYGFNAHLKVAGRKPDNNYFDKVLESYDASDFVIYEGLIDPEYKGQFFSDIIFLLSFSKVESFGMSNLESCLFGVPVIAYDIGGVSMVIKHGVNGFLSSLGDSEQNIATIRQILDDNKAYISITTSCFDYTKSKFSEHHFKAEVHKLYNFGRIAL
ncbi:glycosyltransferase family 4 protein [Vibrio owensii]|uniref:glycosyltransferase family 4 protein n=1 Tax=Vibrio owensii TaxID=696485 RepID=UPI00339496DF